MTQDYLKGVTHCRPHGNQMPCAKCGKELLEMKESGELEDLFCEITGYDE